MKLGKMKVKSGKEPFSVKNRKHDFGWNLD